MRAANERRGTYQVLDRLQTTNQIIEQATIELGLLKRLLAAPFNDCAQGSHCHYSRQFGRALAPIIPQRVHTKPCIPYRQRDQSDRIKLD
jgi:hypothetical protein